MVAFSVILYFKLCYDSYATIHLLLQKYKHGFIRDPFCLSPKHTLRDVINVKKMKGFAGVPITETGEIGGVLVGIVTSRDIDFMEEDMYDTPVSQVIFLYRFFIHILVLFHYTDTIVTKCYSWCQMKHLGINIVWTKMIT